MPFRLALLFWIVFQASTLVTKAFAHQTFCVAVNFEGSIYSDSNIKPFSIFYFQNNPSSMQKNPFFNK